MSLEKIFHITDIEHPMKGKVPDGKLPTLDVLLIGEGRSNSKADTLTIYVEHRVWKETDIWKQYLTAHPNQNNINGNGNVQKYAAAKEITFMYEFDTNTGELKGAGVYRGSRTKDPYFRHKERLIEQWKPEMRNNKHVRKKEAESYNNTVIRAYQFVKTTVKSHLNYELGKNGIKMKEKDGLKYFMNAIENACKYDSEKIKIKY